MRKQTKKYAFLVYMYYTHSFYQTSISGKNYAYFILFKFLQLHKSSTLSQKGVSSIL